jgi:hypothetical protein
MSRWQWGWVVATAAWLGGTAFGVSRLWVYENAPGPLATAPPRWPAGTGVRLDPSRFTVLLFAHPHCPCSRASLAELAHVMRGAGGRANAHVLFLVPDGVADGWEQTDLWDAAAAIPETRPERDRRGAEALRFGAHTSGLVVAYAPDGALAFRGGITPARGHTGANPGRDGLSAVLSGGAAGGGRAVVFGCPLDDPAGSCEGKP